jgi:adenylate cyclase
VEAGELRSVASRLADAASSLIDPPVRLVKTIGDAIMLSSRETGALLQALFDLPALLRKDPTLPAVHMGIARGPAHVGGADVYGASVNLASRLTDLAPPGSLLASESVRDDVPGPHPWHAREVRVKGLDRPLCVYELTMDAALPGG